MKLWAKYLMGIVLGFAAACVLPESVINLMTEFAVRFGRYTLLPLLFFSISSSVFTLHSERKSLSATVWIALSALILTLIITLFGMASALIVRLPPIPISAEPLPPSVTIDVAGLLLQLFPVDGFSALTDGAFILPCFVFAGFAGIGCAMDPEGSRPVVTLINSASKVCYSIMSLFLELLALGMIAISARWVMDFSGLLKDGTFVPILALLACDFLIVFLVIIPLVLRLFCREVHPYRVVFASLCPVMTALFAGDANMVLQLQMRHCKESLGVRRRINGSSLPLLSVFARGGSALVMAVCFVAILRSYSRHGISSANVLWIGGTVFILSFLLGALPKGGPFVAVTLMCGMFGRGISDGYILLKSAAPVLCCIACAIDTAQVMAANYIVAYRSGCVRHIELKKFI